MISYFFSLPVSVIWLLASISLLLVELSTPGLFFFVSFAFGCLFGALGAALGYSLTVQCCAALLVSLIQFNAMRRALRRFTTTPTFKSNVQALVGQEGVVVKEISPPVLGDVKIGGEVWLAQADEPIEIGSAVKILRIEGNKVIVAQNEPLLRKTTEKGL